jgi:hypothetical protein
MGGAYSMYGRRRIHIQNLDWMPQEKMPLEVQVQIGEEKLDLKEKGLYNVDWVYGFQYKDRWRQIGNTIMKLRVPYKAENAFNSRLTAVFSTRRTLPHVDCCSGPVFPRFRHSGSSLSLRKIFQMLDIPCLSTLNLHVFYSFSDSI